MNILRLDSITFPVTSASIKRIPDIGEYCWCIDVNCGSSPELNDEEWPEDREEQELDWVAGSEPYLYAQLLPLRVESPKDLAGRSYSFPQTPGDDPADWEPDQWPFFCLYLMEHDYVYPAVVKFSEDRNGRLYLEFEGKLPICGREYDLRVGTTLVCDDSLS